MVAHTFNGSTPKAEVICEGQPGLHTEFQDSQGSVERFHLQTQKQINKKQTPKPKTNKHIKQKTN